MRIHISLSTRHRRAGRRFAVAVPALLVLLLCASSAMAVDRSPLYPRFDRSGFYVGIGGLYQYNVFSGDIESVLEDEIDDALLGANSTVDLDESGGFDMLVGYRVWSFLALELKYEWVDEYDINGSIDVPTPDSGTVFSLEGHTLTANMKLIAPLWRFQPYFVLGGGVAISDVSRGDLDAALDALEALGDGLDEGANVKPAGRAGIGIDMYLTRHIVLFVEGSVVVTTLKEPDIGDVEDLNYMGFGAGLQYRF